MDKVTFAILNKKINSITEDVDQIATQATEAWLEDNIDPSTGYVLDNTLTLDNAAPPASAVGDLKSAIGEDESKIFEETEVVYTKDISVSVGSSVSASTKQITTDVASGQKFKIKIVDPTPAIPSNKAIFLYAFDQNGTRESISNSINFYVNIEYTFVAPKKYTAFSIYIIDSTVSTSGTITYQLTVVTEHQNTIEEKANNAVPMSDYIIAKDLEILNRLWISSNNTRANYYIGIIKNGGELVIENLPNGYEVGLQAYSDPSYTTKVYDSGWIPPSGIFTVTINTNYYYYTTIRKTTGDGKIKDVTELEGLTFTEKYMVIIQVKDNTSRLDKDYNHSVMNDTVKTIAHRGNPVDAPQNTAPAYIIARKHGLTIAENDITTTSDGKFVCWHDTTFSLCGDMVDINGYLMYTDGTDFYYVDPSDSSVYTWDGTDYVASAASLGSLTRCEGVNYAPSDLPLSVMKRIDVGAYKSLKFRGTQILTFAEWVALCKKLGMKIYIDRKISYTNSQLEDLAEIVKNLGMGENASWIDLSTSQIEVLRDVIEGARVGLLEHPTAERIALYKDYNVGGGVFFNGNAKTGMTEQAIQLGLSNGFEVEVWYVSYGTDTEETIFGVIQNAVSYGVTGITLDKYRVDEAFTSLYDSY